VDVSCWHDSSSSAINFLYFIYCSVIPSIVPTNATKPINKSVNLMDTNISCIGINILLPPLSATAPDLKTHYLGIFLYRC